MKMTGTVTVTIHRSVFHPKYKKRFRSSKKFLADTNGMDLGMGDMVTITECGPLSKRKCFKVTAIVKAAPRDMVGDQDVAGVKREKQAPAVTSSEK